MPKAQCTLCNQRKGKRPCPARGAPICPQCCARNRVAVIDCPPDCSYLGAQGSMLLAQRSGADAPKASAQQILDFMNDIMASEPRTNLVADAEPTATLALSQLAKFVDDSESDGAVEGAIWEWVLFGARDAQGVPLVDHIVSRFTRPLSADEQAALRGLHATRYRLLTIEELPAADTGRMKDLLTEEELNLTMPELAERYEVGNAIGCFVTPCLEGATVQLGAWLLPDDTQESIPSRLRELQGETCLAELPLADFLTRLSILVPLLIFEHFAEREGDGGGDFFPPSSF
ncbi:MAG: hypothetical protein ABI333_13360 [bacterium]